MKYTVNVTKHDGAKSLYHVLACSAGGAENMVLHRVYAAKYALATEGWSAGVKHCDLFTEAYAAGIIATVREC